ncbi:MAG: type II toxin-antitoxin system death-on-curing family toxin [Deltaproteobacteria bacterium]|nr:type II toxin-antitoxin system death-on-curing family toxin [Deltaproteobacteria bacterium]
MNGDKTFFLTLDEALAIHDKLIDVFGGAGGVRDLGLLESALYRPRTGYYVELMAMAAALFESLLNNPAFIDGNKRVAFFATDVFLRLNGWKLQVEAAQAEVDLIGMLEEHEANFAKLEVWIRKHAEALR